MNFDATLQEWRRLFSAATAFHDVAPWTWMTDGDMFAVENPDDGTIGYCSILGAGGAVFGLAVLLGDRALLTALAAPDLESLDPIDAMDYTYLALTVTFEDREELTSKDRSLIKRLGLSFRGRKAWPQFRFQEPGYVEWYLDREQVRFLTVALEQAIEVALAFRRNPNYLIPPIHPIEDEEVFLLRHQTEEWGEWESTWHIPDFEAATVISVTDYDYAEMLRRLGIKFPSPEGTWEVDFLFMPGIVQERRDERPYYPRAVVCADAKSGLILDVHTSDPGKFEHEVAPKFLEIIGKVGRPPKTLRVRNPEVAARLAAVTKAVGVDIKMVRWLPAVDEFRAELLRRMAY